MLSDDESCSGEFQSQSEPSSEEVVSVVVRTEPEEENSVPCASTKATDVKRKRSPKKRSGRKPSDVWDHFDKYAEPLLEKVDGVEKVAGHTRKARCKYCQKPLCGNGTSSLRKHIEISCPKYPGRVNVETQKVLTIDNWKGGALISLDWTQEACIEVVTHMIVVDELPFSFIEKPGFNHFYEVSVPLFIVPKRKVIVKTFMRMYDAKREELRSELQSLCVRCQTDTWTSCQNINYMVVTSHFIDRGWQMHKRVLAFCVVPNHNGITIEKIVESVLLEWGIERVLTNSVDNASANKVAIDYVRVKIYVRASGARLDEFKNAVEKSKCESHKVCILDVPTRWSSTFLMLDTALELKKAFERMKNDETSRYASYFNEQEAEDEVEDGSEYLQNSSAENRKKKANTTRIGPPGKEDWDNAGTFVKFLKVFYDITLDVSASLTPTAHKAFHNIITIEVELEELSEVGIGPDSSEADKVLYDMAVMMKLKYSKYFGSLKDMNHLFMVALVLDPRYKLKYIERNCETMLNMMPSKIKKKSDKVKQLVIELCDPYATQNGTHDENRSQRKTQGRKTRTHKTTKRQKARTIMGKRLL